MANKKIKIPLSEEDLQELLNGETFDWTFDGVDVHLYMGYDDEDGTACIKCGNPVKMFQCNNENCSNAGEAKSLHANASGEYPQGTRTKTISKN